MTEYSHPVADVFFMPFSVPEADGFGTPDPGLLARRIPHFLHMMLNEGGSGPTGMLEVQSSSEDGKARWVTLEDPIDPRDALELVPDNDGIRGIVTGVLSAIRVGLRVELRLFGTRDQRTHVLCEVLRSDDPVAGLCALASGLARLLRLPWLAPPPGLLTSRADAFYRFLQGLDGLAMLSSDVQRDDVPVADELARPFSDALGLDPTFGLALRTAHMAIASALEGSQMGEADGYRALDRCFAAHPADGDGCVAVAEHLAILGDHTRARAWLEHATQLEPPPARGLESLGVLLANRGDMVAARDLWLRGVTIDGHPDFFAHLARLAFSEDQADEAWDKVLRGLRRIYERSVRASEWEDDGRGAGLLLRYLTEHLEDVEAPSEVAEALGDLAGLLTCPEDRVDLGYCLHEVHDDAGARAEILAGLDEVEDLDVRDRGVRTLLAIDVADFEPRYAAAAEMAVRGPDPDGAKIELGLFASEQPAFWPARFLSALADRRMGREDDALDELAEVLRCRPGQADALTEMAELFDMRGNPKRALECVEDALESKPDDASLVAARARYLHALDRRDAAREEIRRAVELDPKSVELRRLRRRIEHSE